MTCSTLSNTVTSMTTLQKRMQSVELGRCQPQSGRPS